MTPAIDFEKTYAEHAQTVYRICRRSVVRKEIAEELTSDVFLALHENRFKLSANDMPAWLYTVAKRRCADFWRRRYREEDSLTWIPQTDGWSEPEHPLAELLVRCEALKPIHRICLTLRFAQGMSRAEIAEQTQLSELQVKSHLQYGLTLMRQFIGPNAPQTSEKGGRTDAEFEPHS